MAWADMFTAPALFLFSIITNGSMRALFGAPSPFFFPLLIPLFAGREAEHSFFSFFSLPFPNPL